ncbi:MAG TPA: hypothetical protein VJ576_02550 [Rhodocyclaceae bacterium]|nr:hypothetical protein [Rhodocyclaceae bacterium]
MASVTFPIAVGGDGSTVTDDGNVATGLANGGHRVRFVPALAQVVAVAQNTVNKAAAANASAEAAATSELAAAGHETAAAGSAGAAAGSEVRAEEAAAQAVAAKNDAAALLQASAPFTFRNRIINGDMRIDQRNAGASVTPTGSNYVLDRWYAWLSQGSKYSIQQSSMAPAGFTSSLLVTSTSSYSVGASDFFAINQIIEGLGISDLAWGSAQAQSVALSFWVHCSLTGTFGGCIQNNARDRSYPFTYTINSANTWEQKTVVIPGDTAGTWLKDTGAGLRLLLGLGVGSTYSAAPGAWAALNYWSATGAQSIVGTNGATFYLTGVQLEAGTVATPFERRPYGLELILCRRYYEKSYDVATAPGSATMAGAIYSGAPATSIYTGVPFRVSKRTAPTVTIYNPVSGTAGNTSGASGNVAVTSSTCSENNIRDISSVNGAYINWHYTASAEL